MMTFDYLYDQVKQHKKKILVANLLAIVVTLLSVPIPLFIPFIVDEVILGKAGNFIATVNQFIAITHPIYYIVIVFILTLILRGIRSLLDVVRRIVVEGGCRRYSLEHT